MKKLVLCTIISISLFACGKEETNETREPLKVSDAHLSINSVLQKKQTATYVSLNYWKEENKGVKDDLSLVVNGVSAKLIKQKPEEPSSSSNALFELPLLNVTGDIKATYTIKSANKSYSGEKILRYVEDYSIATVWEKLDKDFLLQNPYQTYIEKDGSFQSLGGITSLEPKGIGLGIYGNMRSTKITTVNPPFIPGLNGSYTARYDSNRMLETIKIYLGDGVADQSFDKKATLEDIAAVYGAAVTDRYERKIYSSGNFDIEVTADDSSPIATIRKVRNNP